MVSKTESGSASVKSNSSKFSVKSIKSAFSKASKSKAVKAEEPVNVAVENTDVSLSVALLKFASFSDCQAMLRND